MNENLLLLYLAIMLIACLYSSVGHGGASGYLALMSIMSMPIATIKPVALILNIIVSSIAFVQFYRKGYFDKHIFLLSALASVPAAYFGGMISIEPTLYKQILGVMLFLAACRLFIPMKKEVKMNTTPNSLIVMSAGACIGFVSGIIGIGGGIILSPLLILLGYANVKNTAGISALFIVVNSIAGLIGLASDRSIEFSSSMFIMVVVAVVGGLIGSYMGSRQLNTTTLKNVLATVLLIASIKLIIA